MLFIGVVIALLLLAFITLSHTHSFFGQKTMRWVDTVQRTDLGLQYALQEKSGFKDTVTVPLDLADGITVKYIKGYWGVFEKYTVVSAFKKNKMIRTALVGERDTHRPALYLQDRERPMVIVGRSRITGDAYLPEQGIRPGNISGQSYYHKRLVYGQKKQSHTVLPKLEENLRHHLDQIVAFPDATYTGKAISVSSGTKMENSFQSPTIPIIGDVIDLSGVALTGNIVVRASQQILVDASTQLTDVVLIAPKIRIGNVVKGRFQAIAKKEIKVGKLCELQYPSALVVDEGKLPVKSTSPPQSPNIHIASHTNIKGIVMYLGQSEERVFLPQIHIDPGVHIIGEVYCERDLELKGNVSGSVSTRSFVALENGSIYQNHLFNGSMDSSTLPLEYSGILYRDGKRKTIAQWLY